MEVRFYYRTGAGPWQKIGWPQNANVLSDEFGDYGHFAGAFTGMACQDLSGMRRPAEFSRFFYRELLND